MLSIFHRLIVVCSFQYAPPYGMLYGLFMKQYEQIIIINMCRIQNGRNATHTYATTVQKFVIIK